MATESERPVEQLLRASAKQRREAMGEALEMHPATRRLLQGEVARQFGRKGISGRGLFAMLLQAGPRLVWVSTAAAVVIVLAAMLIPLWTNPASEPMLAKSDPVMAPALREEVNKTDTEIAAAAPAQADVGQKNEPMTDSESKGTVQVALQDLSKEEALDKDESRVAKQAATVAQANSLKSEKPKPAESSGAAAASVSVPLDSVAAESAAFARRYGLARTDAPSSNVASPGAPLAAGAPSAAADSRSIASPPPLAATEKSKLSLASSSQPLAAAKTMAPAMTDGLITRQSVQRFVRVKTTTSANAPTRQVASVNSAVLNSFRMQQTGLELTVVDNDGSVYTGIVHVASNVIAGRMGANKAGAPTAGTGMLGQEVGAAKPASGFIGDANSAAFSFRVSVQE